MFELRQEILMSTGSASHLLNNLSIFFHEAKHVTLACVVHENQVCCILTFRLAICVKSH